MAISRDALLIYLKDLRTLETIVNESKSKVRKLTNKMDGLKVKEITIEEPKRPKDVVPRDTTGERGCLVIGLISLALGIGGIAIELAILGVPAVIFAVFMFILAIVCRVSTTNDYEAEKWVHDEQMEEYHKKMKDYERQTKRIKTDMENKRKEVEQQKQEMTKVSEEIQGDIDMYREMLEEAYRADIIPLQFRNIEGVYYLYDFLSTSQLTLTDALMHADLQSIKDKLDTVIQLQKVNVIQQAQANAKLDDIQQTNQDILATARATENNTAVAAQYARIAAVNSQVSVKLQAKQLAYQTADFWLK